jgi:CheY-like chemotaxis protein
MVVIIDDDKISNFITMNQLKKVLLDEPIRAFTSSVEAFKFIEKEQDQINLILLDISMPEMDGFTFLKNYEAANLKGTSKIAMYTSSIRDADKQKAMHFSDVIDFIVKPAEEDHLRKLIEMVE